MKLSRRAFCLHVPLACAALLLAPGCTKATRTIKIEAKRFSFTPNLITLKKGEPVVLEVTALDFPHGFNIPEMNLRHDLIPGKAVPIALTPDRAGRFGFLCDNFCGSGHEQMEGTIVVTA
jgi:cytochrome c oxidase subunit 2